MHKCFRCGTEFEGSYCPECGTQWQEEKHCPSCGATLAGSVKFCNNCGYSFVESTEKKKKETGKVGAFFKKAWAWIRSHLKIVIPTAIALVAVTVVLSLIPTFILMSVNGTYYAYTFDKDGEIVYSEDTFITLSAGKWKDSDGMEGKYSLSGSDIKLTYEDEAAKDLSDMMGDLGGEIATTVEMKGTVKNDVLTVTEGKRELAFAKKNHKHKYGEWEVAKEPTCIEEGFRQHTCDCKKAETETIAVVPHNYVWQTTIEPTCTEEGEQKYMCSMCKDIGGSEKTQTISAIGHEFEKGICTRCDYTQLKYELNSDETVYIVTGFNDEVRERTDIFILSEYDGKPVISIGYEAFRNCNELTSITIPNSVTSIGRSAFSYCYELTSITIPNSVTSIGEYAFSGCSGLTSITVESGNTKYHSVGNCLIETATKTLILGCKTSVIPTDGSVTSIGDSAFSYCRGLTSITIPNSVTSIGDYAFCGCDGLTSVTIGNSVTSIGEHAFWGCDGLTSITFQGTKAQWKAIDKGYAWNYLTDNYTVQCSDGKLDQNGNEIA